MMINNDQTPPPHRPLPPNPTTSIEFTVISAEGLKSTLLNTLLSRPLQPFVTLSFSLPFPLPLPSSSTPSPPHDPPHSDSRSQYNYRTSVDRQGGSNPTWNERFHFLLVDPASSSSIHLRVLTGGIFGGEILLGWCDVPAGDVLLSAAAAAGAVRLLSYRLRDRDGTKGQGVVNLGVRLEEGAADPGRPVMGLPVPFSTFAAGQLGNCRDTCGRTD